MIGFHIIDLLMYTDNPGLTLRLLKHKQMKKKQNKKQWIGFCLLSDFRHRKMWCNSLLTGLPSCAFTSLYLFSTQQSILLKHKSSHVTPLPNSPMVIHLIYGKNPYDDLQSPTQSVP